MQLVRVLGTNPITVYLVLYKALIHCSSCLKQLYSSNKMERFNYKGECGVLECTHITTFKKELSWAIDKRLWLIINAMSVVATTKNLKNKAVFNLKQYCMHCYVTLSNIFQLMRTKM